MYKEQISLNPSQIYVYLDFDCVKKEITSKFNNIEDFGDVVLTKQGNFALSINNIGNVSILYNSLSRTELEALVNDIEESFKNIIHSFKFEKQNILN